MKSKKSKKMENTDEKLKHVDESCRQQEERLNKCDQILRDLYITGQSMTDKIYTELSNNCNYYAINDLCES